MKKHLILGVIFSLIGMLAYSSQVALIKAQISSLPLPIVVFIQSAIALFIISLLLFKNGLASAKKILTTHKVHFHLMRACAGLMISYSLFFAVQFVPIVNAMLLANTAPLMVPFIAFFFMKQSINHRLWIPLFIGFIGVMLVLHPNVHLFQTGSLIALGTAFFMASSLLIVRKLSVTDSNKTITFYFFLFSTIISGMVSIPYWSHFSLMTWVLLVFIGSLYFICQYLMTYALRLASAQLVGVLLYSSIIYSAFISMIFFHQVPDWVTFAGIILTVVGGILCIRVEYLNRKKISGIQIDEVKYAKANEYS